jgi:hypothetical protein
MKKGELRDCETFMLGFYYWLDFVDKKVTVLLLELGHRSLIRFSRIYCSIFIKKEKFWKRRILQNIDQEGKGVNKENIARIFIKKEIAYSLAQLERFFLKIWFFLVECLNSKKSCLDTIGRKFMFSACPNSLADVNHSKVMFSLMSGHPTDISSRMYLFCIMSGHRSWDCGVRKFFMQMSGH